MLKTGPVPYFIHGIIEYVAALAFLLAPFALEFESDAATYLSVAIGVVVLVIAATTVGSTSLVDAIPIVVHVVLDFTLAVFLIAVPFIFGFSDETPATAFFIAIGVIHLLLTIATRFHVELGIAGDSDDSPASGLDSSGTDSTSTPE